MAGESGVDRWTLVGRRHRQPRPSWTAAVLAFLFAWQVMVDVPPRYPMYMTVLAFAGSAWFAWQGVRARALLAFLFVPVVLFWLDPLVGGDRFTAQGIGYFLPHAALSLLFGVAAYTWSATERAS